MSETKRECVSWIAFVEEMPIRHQDIILARVDCSAKIVAVAGPITGITTELSKHWTHWHPVEVVEQKPKPDHCRESWEKFDKQDFNQSGDIEIRLVPLGGGNKVFMDDRTFRVVWNLAIAAAKQHGLENV